MLLACAASQRRLSCLYPLNMQQIESPYGLLTMSNNDTTGSFTIQGAPMGTLIGVAAPTGAFAGTGAALALSSGKRVIETQVGAFPAGTVSGAGSHEKYRFSSGEYTAALSNAFTAALEAWDDGSYRFYVYRGAGLVQVHASTLGSRPTFWAIIYNGDAGTAEVRVDNTPVVLDDNTYTPGNYVSFLFGTEFSFSSAGDAGKILTATKATQASNLLGTYTAGELDGCGNPI